MAAYRQAKEHTGGKEWIGTPGDSNNHVELSREILENACLSSRDGEVEYGSRQFGASGEKEWILPLNIISCNSPISISKIEDSHTPVETNADPAGSVDAGTSTNHYLGMFSCCFLLHCLLYAAALLYSSPNPNTGKTLKKGLLWLHDFENQQCYHRYTTPNEPTSPKTNKETSTIESLSAERAYTTQETSPSPRRKTVDNP